MTSPGPDPSHQPAIRISDAERESATERLRAAVAEGRLELAELDERLGVAYAAKTQSELEAVTADLPALAASRSRPLQVQTTSGSFAKTGRWVVPSHIEATSRSGSIKLDFTQAVCPHQKVFVKASATSGSILMIVPIGWGVVMDQVTSSSGSAANKVNEQPAVGFPVVVVEGQVKSGSVRARYPRRSFSEWLLRHAPSH